MAETTIEWTNFTFNPWWGCARISPGCRNCYADTLARRYGHELWRRKGDRRMLSEQNWRRPLKWNRDAERAGIPAKVFCASMADVFEDHPQLAEPRERLWQLIEATPWLRWQLLTKRPENVTRMVPWGDDWPDTVWLGVSVENQRYADERIPVLLGIPAKTRFLSCEPLVGPVDLSQWIRKEEICGCPSVSRERGVQSGRVGRADDRLSRARLASSSSAGRPMGRSDTPDPLRASQSGALDRVIPSGASDVRGRAGARYGAPPGVASSVRADSAGLHDQPQERHEGGQPPEQPGVSHATRAAAARQAGATAREARSVWTPQRDGEADNRTGSGDLLAPSGRRASTCPRCGLRGPRADDFEDRTGRPSISWLIVGGESGPKARPMHPDWARSLREQCRETGTAFFFKQAGTVLAREWGCSDRKGHDPAEWPETFPRQFPAMSPAVASC